MKFFRFPHTPHLAWLGPDRPRRDKVLSEGEVTEILANVVTVEEKVDGANVGISVDERGDLRAQNRGAYLTREHSQPEFKPFFRWLAERRENLVEALGPCLILFGEWCYAVHSVRYDCLPDWFLAFDVYDRQQGRFWSVERRNRLATRCRLSLVPGIARGRFDLPELVKLLGASRLGSVPAEGLYIRSEEGGLLEARAKLVRAEFVTGIEQHWSRRDPQTNRLAAKVAGR